MKKMLSILTVSLSTLLTTSVMAGTNYDHRDRYESRSSSHQHIKNQHPYSSHQYNAHRSQSESKQHIKPARDWKKGQILPRQFQHSAYEVNYRDASRLSKPNKNQQWLKINGDYVLINERNHKIVRIVA